ncbi:hypothetical protein MJO28_006700 [Puccinia striiformis f. sp. tritici]|uniref:Uncharacterized protein n=1 Tax=Puccinia striiformis f. sp. tritici TaxID=168172 RepID=A0ACC0EHS7_9BASI|nr:hypothetical protein MJO28_006700 [Puccinia striiformis f. sp. tritici]
MFLPNLPSFKVLHHHKPGGLGFAGPSEKNQQEGLEWAVCDQSVNLGITGLGSDHGGWAIRSKPEIDDFQQSDKSTHNPRVLHVHSLGDTSPTSSTAEAAAATTPPLEQQPSDHNLGLPEFFRQQPPHEQSPSPVLAREVWDHLFRGEVGIWSSFHHI